MHISSPTGRAPRGTGHRHPPNLRRIQLPLLWGDGTSRPISPAKIFSSTVHGAFFLTRKAGLPRERKRSGSRGKRTSSEMSKFSPVGRKRAIWRLRGREWGVHSRRKAAFLQKTVGKILQKSAFSSLQGDFSMVYCSSARKCVSSYAPWLRFAALTGPTAQLCGDNF